MTKKIAIVEDDFLLALVMKNHFHNEGYECSSFSNASDFFEFYNKNADLKAIILDVKIKGAINGIQLFDQFSKTSTIPVIFSTGNSDLKDLKCLQTDQVKGIFIKPIFLDELSKLIETL